MKIYYCIKIEGAENENLIMVNEMLGIGGDTLQYLTARILDPGELAFEPKT